MTHSTPASAHNFFKSACIFEASLSLVALLIGWFADINPIAALSFDEAAILLGILGTLPLVLLFLTLQILPINALQTIQQLLMNTLVSRLYALHWTDLLVLSAIAGIAEELLFRGTLQPWFENLWGIQSGLWISSVIFGLVHAVTPLYALLATLVSVYLGLSLDYSDTRNLLTPMIIHGLYDFLIFILLVRQYKKQHLAT